MFLKLHHDLSLPASFLTNPGKSIEQSEKGDPYRPRSTPEAYVALVFFAVCLECLAVATYCAHSTKDLLRFNDLPRSAVIPHDPICAVRSASQDPMKNILAFPVTNALKHDYIILCQMIWVATFYHDRILILPQKRKHAVSYISSK